MQCNIAHRTHYQDVSNTIHFGCVSDSLGRLALLYKEEVAEGGNITLAICMMMSHDRTLATLVEVTLHIIMKEEVVQCMKDMKVEQALCGMV